MILKDVRHQTDVAENEERYHLITKKDLNNIKKDIGLGNSLNDANSVELWIESMKEDGNIIYEYKRQNNDHPLLKYEDFSLAFSFDIQLNMFNSFGGDRICIDSTHGTTGYDFELVTIMVIDEFEEGFPVAFCLTSTVSFKTMSYFFKMVKLHTELHAKTEVFMSDDAPFFL